MTREDVIRKIRLLRAKGASTDSEHEAQAIGAMVARMVREHRISMSELEFERMRAGIGVVKVLVDPSEAGLQHSSRPVKWFQVLATLCANCYMCRPVAIMKSQCVYLVGFEHDLELAKGMLLYLTMVAEDMSQGEYVKYFYQCRDCGDVTRARGFRASWLYGFCLRLKERFEQEDARVRSEVSPTALARLGGDVVLSIDRWIGEEMSVEKRRTGNLLNPERANLAGLKSGSRAADAVPLRQEKERLKA